MNDMGLKMARSIKCMHPSFKRHQWVNKMTSEAKQYICQTKDIL